MTTYRDLWKVYDVAGNLLFETHDVSDVERAPTGTSVAFYSAQDQQEHDERAAAHLAMLAKLELEAEQRAYERSPRGRQEAALRDSAESPGGRVTEASAVAFEDAFAGHRAQDDPLVGRW